LEGRQRASQALGGCSGTDAAKTGQSLPVPVKITQTFSENEIHGLAITIFISCVLPEILEMDRGVPSVLGQRLSAGLTVLHPHAETEGLQK
jgi:hypothetical protein